MLKVEHRRGLTVFCLFTFATAAGLFLRAGISSPCWMVIYAVTLGWVMLRPGETWAVITRVWIVFLPPIYYCLSAAWSIASWETLTAGVQLLMTTLIAIRLAASIKTRCATTCLALVMLSITVLSLINGQIEFFAPAWEHNGALLGMYTQKNGMGKAVVLTCAALMALCWCYGWRISALLVWAILLPVVLMTRSAGAELCYICLAVFPFMLVGKDMTTLSKTNVILAVVLMGVALIAVYEFTGGDLRQDLLSLTGKSQTLTGRLDIWQLGLERWRDDWLTGIGYRGFWSYDTFALRKIHHEIEDGLYWFHNIYIDILVAGGVTGAVIFSLSLLAIFWRMLCWWLTSDSVDAALWWMILLISMIAGGADNVMFTPHGFNHLLIVMGYTFARRDCFVRTRRTIQRQEARYYTAEEKISRYIHG